VSPMRYELGFLSQKTTFFIVTAVKTSNLTLMKLSLRVPVRRKRMQGKVMKNGVFWVVTPCGSCKNRRFGEKYLVLHQGDKN
jgi:hypothetical protein